MIGTTRGVAGKLRGDAPISISALVSIAAMERTSRHVSNVPARDMASVRNRPDGCALLPLVLSLRAEAVDGS